MGNMSKRQQLDRREQPRLPEDLQRVRKAHTQGQATVGPKIKSLREQQNRYYS